MLQTSARLLRLLSLLESRRDWGGPELAERLGVSVRTVRRDVDKLRELGYPVAAATGTLGGYRLGAGAALPPLLLDDEEAVAVGVALRTAAGGAVTGIEETALSAMTKLEQVLPPRLRHRVRALNVSVLRVPTAAGPTVDPQVLTTLAAVCRDTERIRFDYRSHEGDDTVRSVEPYRLVAWGRRWYLVAYDLDRDDWRTFRVDRITPRIPTGPRFTPRPLPADDLADYVARRVSTAPWRHPATVRVLIGAEQLAARIPGPAGQIEPVDEHSCLLRTGADSLDALAAYLGLFGADFEVLDPPELVRAVAALADRYARAAGPVRS
ncbi:DNA-binding transcriptional regulator [Actinocatenispora thailandica]|uniref:DNA-binding transcriptional regulator n=1 Tax=Actinocatenispora thailandica TaxID=227318 RepID=A0A7R7DPW6_9ACTN|nr:YafY family protein [Actinocatenispora thailandica]BCJ35342.1 DNA-binding transcriptional regulator [Actinocatenispora thailandica]